MADQQAVENFKHSGKYLPKILRDFHDQKAVFKHLIGGYKVDNYMNIDIPWTVVHMLVIDWFLWKMANYGYTLQKSRVKIDFYDPDVQIAHKEKQETDAFVNILNSHIQERAEINKGEGI